MLDEHPPALKNRFGSVRFPRIRKDVSDYGSFSLKVYSPFPAELHFKVKHLTPYCFHQKGNGETLLSSDVGKIVLFRYFCSFVAVCCEW